MSVQGRYPDFQKDQRQFFDSLITEDWESYFSPEWDSMRNWEVARLFRNINPEYILDVGCGCGYHDKVMADYPFVKRVDAIDYSQRSIEKAETYYPHPSVHREVSDFLSFSPGTLYDLVVSFQVIEHLQDIDSYFSCTKTFAKPTGYIAVITPNRSRIQNRFGVLKGRPPSLLDPQHFREYSIRDLISTGARHGLKVIDTFGHTVDTSNVPWLNRLSVTARIRLGSFWPSIAHIVGVIYKRRSFQ
jgi:cyclopropane fatty-acyl-phospholipid synthase-like methyltransferase